MPSKRAGKNVKGASPQEIARQAKKTFGSVGKAAKKINDIAASKITVPLARKLVNETKGAVSDLEAKLFTTGAVEMKKGGGMKAKGMMKGGAMKAKGMMKGGAMKAKGMKKGGKMKAKGMAMGGKMKTKGMAKGGKMKTKGYSAGGALKGRGPSKKNTGLFG